MIKFVAQRKDGPLIGFGLSKRNIELLQHGKPVVVNLADLGLPPGKIMIFYGKTEKDMAAMLSEFIGPGTTVIGEKPDE